MTMCIILLVAAARLTSIDTQFLRSLLEEILAGLLTTIFFLRVYTRSIIILPLIAKEVDGELFVIICINKAKASAKMKSPTINAV